MGAPTAENKNSLFDWQLENNGAKTLDQFGGVDGLVAALNSNIENVSVSQYDKI